MIHFSDILDIFFGVEFYWNLDMTTAIFNAILEVSFFFLFLCIFKKLIEVSLN